MGDEEQGSSMLNKVTIEIVLIMAKSSHCASFTLRELLESSNLELASMDNRLPSWKQKCQPGSCINSGNSGFHCAYY